MHHLAANQTSFAFRPDAEPVLRVRPGEVVRFETSPEPVERLFAAGPRWIEAIDLRAINAVTGPVFIEGVMPGDAVSVEVLAIEPLDWAWNAAIPGFGLLDGLLPGPMLERLPIRDGEVIVSERVRLPLRPMIGCLGLAPAEGRDLDSLAGDAVGRELRSHPDRSGRDRALPGAGPRRTLLAGRSPRGDGRARGDVRCHRVRRLGDGALRRPSGDDSGNAAHRDRGPHLRHRSQLRAATTARPGCRPRASSTSCSPARRSSRRGRHTPLSPPAAISHSAARPERSSWAAFRVATVEER